MKHKLIQDIIHNNIELSNFEFLLLKDPIINRLQQILQNSASYTVYPNMKASRFEHSLGAMSYTGAMYRYGIINSKFSNEYFKDKLKWLEKRISESHQNIFENYPGDNSDIFIFEKKLKEQFNISDTSEIHKIFKDKSFAKYLEDYIGENFVLRNLQYREDELFSINILLFQAVRLFGLLHDVGHLPLSHLFEFSIESLHEYLDELKEDGMLKTESEKRYYQAIKGLLTDSEDQIHENIGKNITRHIFSRILTKKLREIDPQENPISGIVKCIIIFTLKEIWAELIKGKGGYFNSLYGIVSGTIDSDRLDYVQRDGFLSGIAKHTGNVDRIIEMFCLGKNPNPDNDIIDNYLFMPSAQSLDSVEEILHHRLRIYRYVINHHAVLRSNYILQKIIERKLRDEIQSIKNGKVSTLVPQRLLDVVDIAIEISKGNISNQTSEKIISKFIQITDFWLFSSLNGDYVKTIGKSKKEYTLQDLLLREVYKSKRAFKSLWKREHEFQSFQLALCTKFFVKWVDLEDSIKKEVVQKLNIEDDDIREVLSNFKEYKKLNNIIETEEKAISSENVKEGNFQKIARLKKEKAIFEKKLIQYGGEILEKIGFYHKVKGPKLLRNLEVSYSEKLDYNILVCKAKITSGIKDFYLINRKGQEEVFDFENFSTKSDSLKMSISDSIKFFVFYHNDDKIETEKVKNHLIQFCLGEVNINLKS